jgi:hypothetical protein
VLTGLSTGPKEKAEIAWLSSILARAGQDPRANNLAGSEGFKPDTWILNQYDGIPLQSLFDQPIPHIRSKGQTRAERIVF